jgi:hypothetical protein
MARITTINGMQVDLDRISNPKLRRVAQERSFMFSYSDGHTHTDHRDTPHSEYRDYKEYDNHTDIIHRDYNEYKDVSTHLDTPFDGGHSDSGNPAGMEHTDIT